MHAGFAVSRDIVRKRVPAWLDKYSEITAVRAEGRQAETRGQKVLHWRYAEGEAAFLGASC